MGRDDEGERLRTKHLLRELDEMGLRSRYADVVRRPQSAAQAMSSLESELLGEMAASLGRAEERLCRALVQLEVLAHKLDRTGAGADEARCAEQVAQFNAARDLAHERLVELRIQREACGFARNEVLDEMYPVPPRR